MTTNTSAASTPQQRQTPSAAGTKDADEQAKFVLAKLHAAAEPLVELYRFLRANDNRYTAGALGSVFSALAAIEEAYTDD